MVGPENVPGPTSPSVVVAADQSPYSIAGFGSPVAIPSHQVRPSVRFYQPSFIMSIDPSSLYQVATLQTSGMIWAWLIFIAFVLSMLALDLGVFHRKSHVVGFKEALGWSGVW